MNTCVALVGAYLRFNGYVTVPEQPVLVGQGKPYRYHTATDIDILAVRFPNAAVVVPREYGSVEDDLHLDIDPNLDLQDDTVDVLIAEVKSGRPRLNEGMRDRDVLYATIRRVDPGFDASIDETIEALIRHGVAHSKSAGKKWRFRLVAFGEGQPAPEGGPYTVVQMTHVAAFIVKMLNEHHQVWKDAQFGDPVLDLLHFFDKLGFTWQLSNRAIEEVESIEKEQRKPKPRQNEKVAPAAKPRARTAARKSETPVTAARKQVIPAGPDAAPAGKNGRTAKAPAKAAVRKRVINNDGWIPGGG